MKFVTVFSAVFMASCLVELGLSSSTLKLTGNASVEFYGPLPEDFWASLSKGHRYPILNSGDVIALRLAYSSSSSYAKYWFYCANNCYRYTCPGTSMTADKWSSCSSYMMFKITAKGKMDGQPINSGDTVSLASKAYGSSSSYRLRCNTSSSVYCTVQSTTSSMTGSDWLTYDYAAFQIFSKQADDGTPVQLGDIVGLKYPYASNSAWLYYSVYFYARSCSSSSKSSCARENCPTGFEIYKQPA